jgi:polyhydroxyalkanoate synthesis regulator protein
MQGPAIQGLMGRYLEQSANAFMEMQQQLQNQTRNIFGSFQFPNFSAAAGKPAPEPEKDGGSDNKS